jgi:hypothetical protein
MFKQVKHIEGLKQEKVETKSHKGALDNFLTLQNCVEEEGMTCLG